MANNELKKRKELNPSYSLRAFARKLQIPAGSLSLILNKKRKLNLEIAKKILTNIGDNPNYNARLLKEFSFKSAGKDDEYFNEVYQELKGDPYSKMTWLHFAVFGIMSVKNFKSDLFWIAKHLNVTTFMVEETINDLRFLKIIGKTAGGKLFLLKENFTVKVDYNKKESEEFTKLAFKNTQLEKINLAHQKLNEGSDLNMTYSSNCMGIDPSKVEKAKEKIRKFRRELQNDLVSDENKNEEVYLLNVQLFPITNIKEKEEESTKSKLRIKKAA